MIWDCICCIHASPRSVTRLHPISGINITRTKVVHVLLRLDQGYISAFRLVIMNQATSQVHTHPTTRPQRMTHPLYEIPCTALRAPIRPRRFYIFCLLPLPAFSLPPFPPTEVERRGGHIPPPFVCVGLGLRVLLYRVADGRNSATNQPLDPFPLSIPL